MFTWITAMLLIVVGYYACTDGTFWFFSFLASKLESKTISTSKLYRFITFFMFFVHKNHRYLLMHYHTRVGCPTCRIDLSSHAGLQARKFRKFVHQDASMLCLGIHLPSLRHDPRAGLSADRCLWWLVLSTCRFLLACFVPRWRKFKSYWLINNLHEEHF